jgi:hypothetical protein
VREVVAAASTRPSSTVAGTPPVCSGASTPTAPLVAHPAVEELLAKLGRLPPPVKAYIIKQLTKVGAARPVWGSALCPAGMAVSRPCQHAMDLLGRGSAQPHL